MFRSLKLKILVNFEKEKKLEEGKEFEKFTAEKFEWKKNWFDGFSFTWLIKLLYFM